MGADLARSSRRKFPPQLFKRIIKVLSFRDRETQAPTHMLIIPKVKDLLTGLSKAEERHREILGYLLYTAKLVALTMVSGSLSKTDQMDVSQLITFMSTSSAGVNGTGLPV